MADLRLDRLPQGSAAAGQPVLSSQMRVTQIDFN